MIETHLCELVLLDYEPILPNGTLTKVDKHAVCTWKIDPESGLYSVQNTAGEYAESAHSVIFSSSFYPDSPKDYSFLERTYLNLFAGMGNGLFEIVMRRGKNQKLTTTRIKLIRDDVNIFLRSISTSPYSIPEGRSGIVGKNFNYQVDADNCDLRLNLYVIGFEENFSRETFCRAEETFKYFAGEMDAER